MLRCFRFLKSGQSLLIIPCSGGVGANSSRAGVGIPTDAGVGSVENVPNIKLRR